MSAVKSLKAIAKRFTRRKLHARIQCCSNRQPARIKFIFTIELIYLLAGLLYKVFGCEIFIALKSFGDNNVFFFSLVCFSAGHIIIFNHAVKDIITAVNSSFFLFRIPDLIIARRFGQYSKIRYLIQTQIFHGLAKIIQ